MLICTKGACKNSHYSAVPQPIPKSNHYRCNDYDNILSHAIISTKSPEELFASWRIKRDPRNIITTMGLSFCLQFTIAQRTGELPIIVL